MKAYSYDLRLHVLRAVNHGRPRAEIVAKFFISLATLKRYLKRQRETGDVRAKLIPGRPAKKGATLQAGLPSQLDAYSDATLAEHCQIWEPCTGYMDYPFENKRGKSCLFHLSCEVVEEEMIRVVVITSALLEWIGHLASTGSGRDGLSQRSYLATTTRGLFLPNFPFCSGDDGCPVESRKLVPTSFDRSLTKSCR